MGDLRLVENRVLLSVLGLCTVLSLGALVRFANSRRAWLKIVMHLWYTVTCLVGIADVLTIAAYPRAKPYWTLFFNVAGQCIAATGVLDVVQQRYCAPRMLTLGETNVLFLRVCGLAYVVILLGGGIVFAVYATTHTGMLTYRVVSMTLISAEVLGYSW